MTPAKDQNGDWKERAIKPEVSNEDVGQEVELQRLLKPRRKISHQVIRKKLEGRLGEELLYNGEQGELPWEMPRVSEDAIGSLIQWTLGQQKKTQQVVFRFLEDPDQYLEQTLKYLRGQKLITSAKDKDHPTKISELLLRSLPASSEEMGEIVRKLGTTRRPQATVRQFIRSALRRDKIKLEKDGKYVRSSKK